MKIATLLFLFLATSFIAFAQPDSSREKQNNEYKRLSEATQRAYSVPSSSSPPPAYKSSVDNSGNNSHKGSSDNHNYINQNPATVTKFKTNAMIQAERQQEIIDNAAEAKRQQIYAAEKTKADNEYEIWNNNRIKTVLDNKDAYMETTTIRDANKALDKRDVYEHNQDLLFQETTKKIDRNVDIDRTDAEQAYIIFMQEYPTASYESLYDLIWRMRVFPFSTSQCLKLMNELNPTKATEIELLELKTMPYYFGAVRPNLYIGSNHNALN